MKVSSVWRRVQEFYRPLLTVVTLRHLYILSSAFKNEMQVLYLCRCISTDVLTAKLHKNDIKILLSKITQIRNHWNAYTKPTTHTFEERITHLIRVWRHLGRRGDGWRRRLRRSVSCRLTDKESCQMDRGAMTEWPASWSCVLSGCGKEPERGTPI